MSRNLRNYAGMKQIRRGTNVETGREGDKILIPGNAGVTICYRSLISCSSFPLVCDHCHSHGSTNDMTLQQIETDTVEP